MKNALFIILTLVLNINLTAQTDSTSFHNLPKLQFRPMVSAAEVLSTNILVNRYDAYIRDLDWAKVTPQHWYDNLHNGFDTDGDAFTTNLFFHPYHGSLFFNSARANGNSFWGSIPYVLAGSWTWEYFGETYPPSEIDWNTTTLGGIFLGEITHRLTAHLLRDDKLREYRVLRNVGATLLNPMAQINGLFYNSTQESYRSPSLRKFPVKSQLSTGISHILNHKNDSLPKSYLHINYSLIYGDLFSNSDQYHPFDFFILRAWIDINSVKDSEKNYFSLTSHAPLWRFSKTDQHTFSVSSHYAFIHNPIFKIGALSLTADYHINIVQDNYSLISGIKGGPILFGSANSEVVQVIELFEEDDGEFLRDYVYGRGLLIEWELLAVTKKNGRFIGSFNNWLIFTQRDTPGTERNAILKVEYYFPIVRNWSLGIEFFHYQRHANYDELVEFQNISNSYSEVKILSTFTF